MISSLFFVIQRLIHSSSKKMNSTVESPAIFETNIENLELITRGKVRDIYRIDDDHMLIVTTDRLSAFDVVFAQPIPGKGELLTRISNFWFHLSSDLVANHLVDLKLEDYVSEQNFIKLGCR